VYNPALVSMSAFSPQTASWRHITVHPFTASMSTIEMDCALQASRRECDLVDGDRRAVRVDMSRWGQRQRHGPR
jgi:hypothetical protein